MGKSRIEWCGSTWNPIRARNIVTSQVGTWCQKISPGCANCYAAAHNHRNLPHGSSGLPYTAQGGERAKIFLDPKMLAEPLRRKKPETYFPCSMTDLFQAAHSPELIAAVWAVMAACPQHTFQVLTKRPERALEFLRWCSGSWNRTNHPWGALAAYAPVAVSSVLAPLGPWPLPNVWLGCSVEDKPRRDRIDHLRETPAALRFLSLEPLLEDLGTLDLSGIGWVIVGGESGHGARPMHPAWVRSLRDQCVAAAVPFFFKQWGEYGQFLLPAGPWRYVAEDGRATAIGERPTDESVAWARVDRVGKGRAGRLLDGRTWDEMPREVAR